MRLRVLATCLLLLFTACPRPIRQTPVPEEDRLRSNRLVAEGSLLLREGKDHLALLKFVEASTLNPYDAVTFNKLAITYSRLLRYHEAERAIQRAVRLNPRYANAFNTRGILYLATQREKKAIRSFRKAIQLRERAIYYVNLGVAYLNRGRYTEGRKAYRRALLLDPEVLKLEGSIQISAAGPETTPEKYFQMALVFAELKDRENSLHYLSKALQGGFRDSGRIYGEPAFAPWREERDFINLVRSYGLEVGDSRGRNPS